MNEATDDSERFMALVADLRKGDPRLSPLQAAIILAAEQGIAHDSRTFARVFGAAHALVLRELNLLAEQGERLRIVSRNARTQRTEYAVDPAAR